MRVRLEPICFVLRPARRSVRGPFQQQAGRPARRPLVGLLLGPSNKWQNESSENQLSNPIARPAARLEFAPGAHLAGAGRKALVAQAKI